MRRDLLRFSQRIASMSPTSGKSISEALRDVDGFPIHAEVESRSVTSVTKVESRVVAESEFAIPTGYTKEALVNK
jgi:hypothetical protein